MTNERKAIERLIPVPTIPSDDEMRAATLSEWNAARPVLLSRIAVGLMALSIKTKFVIVPTKTVIDEWLPAFDGKGPSCLFSWLVCQGFYALKEFPGGFFFKLDGRSPKDMGIVRYTPENLGDLCGNIFGSERMLDDLRLQRFHRNEFILCFREWVDLRDEHRVFVKDHEIQGVTRYDYLTPAPIDYASHNFRSGMRHMARCLHRSIEFEMSDLGTYVFDFGFAGDKLAPILIEMNPYGLSDPCCFVEYANIGGYAWERPATP